MQQQHSQQQQRARLLRQQMSRPAWEQQQQQHPQRSKQPWKRLPHLHQQQQQLKAQKRHRRSPMERRLQRRRKQVPLLSLKTCLPCWACSDGCMLSPVAFCEVAATTRTSLQLAEVGDKAGVHLHVGKQSNTGN